MFSFFRFLLPVSVVESSLVICVTKSLIWHLFHSSKIVDNSAESKVNQVIFIFRPCFVVKIISSVTFHSCMASKCIVMYKVV